MKSCLLLLAIISCAYAQQLELKCLQQETQQLQEMLDAAQTYCTKTDTISNKAVLDANTKRKTYLASIAAYNTLAEQTIVFNEQTELALFEAYIDSLNAYEAYCIANQLALETHAEYLLASAYVMQIYYWIAENKLAVLNAITTDDMPFEELVKASSKCADAKFKLADAKKAFEASLESYLKFTNFHMPIPKKGMGKPKVNLTTTRA